MKKLVKLILMLGLVLIFSSAVFAGGQQDVASEDGVVSITFWHFPFVFNVPGYEEVSAEYGGWETFLADEFMKVNPGIKVNTELVPWEGGTDKINVAIAGGTAPDLVFDYLGRSGGWYTQGAAVAVDNIIPATLSDNLLDSFKATYTIDGNLHAVPGFSWNMNQIVNRGALRKMGITGEILNGVGNPYTHQEFEDLLMQIKEKSEPGFYPLALGCGSKQGDYIWWQYFWGFGASLFESDGSVVKSSPEMVEAYEWLVSLRDKGLIAPGVASMAGADTMQLWASGKVAIHGGNAHYRNVIKKGVEEGSLDMDVDVIPMVFPSENGDKGFNGMGPTGFIVFADDEAKQQATGKFIDFMMQDKYWEAQCAGAGQFPATKTVAAMNIYADDVFQTEVGAMMSKYPAGDFALSNPNYDKIRTALSSCGQAIFSGISSPEDAVANFLDEVRELNGK